MLNTPAPFHSGPESFQTTAEKDLSNLKGRDQSGKPISVIQVMAAHARSPILKQNPSSMILKDDGSPREEAVHGITIVKRNTYQTVHTGPAVDPLGHTSKRHTQSPRLSEIKGVI
jgi:hypothetical protein